MPFSKRNEHHVDVLVVDPLGHFGPLACPAPNAPPIRFSLFSQNTEDEQGRDGLREVDGDGALEGVGEHVRSDLKELEVGELRERFH